MNTICNTEAGSHNCWLNYNVSNINCQWNEFLNYISTSDNFESNQVNMIALKELNEAITTFKGSEPIKSKLTSNNTQIHISTLSDLDDSVIHIDNELTDKLKAGGFAIKLFDNTTYKILAIIGKDPNGVLYGVYNLIKSINSCKTPKESEVIDNPVNLLRMINHWDNMDGSIERGYAGNSIFFKNNTVIDNNDKFTNYARLLSSIGINGIVINNVNVHKVETKLITSEYLPQVSKLANIFRNYGIKLFLSINFASPIEIGGLTTADPLDAEVISFWEKTADEIYRFIPDFGGFLVKADSEFRPGPFTYGRNHADGANMLASALESHGGLVIWRCFVYNCLLDWRDRKKDRAKAAYENFEPLDGKFKENVILQVKNGPMDFQIREPISPLFGAMEHTNQLMEFQVTQEYTGQQKHLCYLVPLWKENLDFDTMASGKGSVVSSIVSGNLFNRNYGGIAGVSNIGNDYFWTGHPLAQANLYGFGRLCWNPNLSSQEIALEWVQQTFGNDKDVIKKVTDMLMNSRDVYEKYTCPLGIGWMVNPSHHYGPSVDGYEYSPWGTYHYADFKGLGVDRTMATGTNYINQYKNPVAQTFESLDTCPEELLLFFHHLPYSYKLKSGKTILQHIYDTHFEGVEKVEGSISQWLSLKDRIDDKIFSTVLDKLNIQLKDSKEWRDVVNTYFYRKTGIGDIHSRKIYE